jgi:lysyl-tRNA synthetase class 2
MGREEQIINERLRKIKELRSQKINPYSHSFNKGDSCAFLQEKYKDIEEEKQIKDVVKVAGRIIVKRDLGKISFASLQDDSGKIQIILKEEETPKSKKEFFKKYVDTGDFIGVEGNIMRTKRGELSILVKEISLLTKAILPLPEKWHGLKDKEERYRKRYLDLAINPEIKEIFKTRGKILETIRDFMKKNNFVEVETPLLQAVYGGASAKPFKTHCDAYNSDLFLSIAPELYLKKALVGGFEKVYEITKKFRNEGVDKSHNPEHMTIEWYEAYVDYNGGMKLFKELIQELVKEIFGKLSFEYQGNIIDVSKWETMTLRDAIKKHLNEDIDEIKTDEQAKEIAKKHGIEQSSITKVNIPDELMKLFREKLIQPTFLIDYPIELTPLAKPKESDSSKAEIFQPFIGGIELARAYSELNDSELQEEHFTKQEQEREKGNIEAMPTDRDFVVALQHAMPPACGVGIGIERLIMLLTNQTSIRDVILFPFMKPEK